MKPDRVKVIYSGGQAEKRHLFVGQYSSGPIGNLNDYIPIAGSAQITGK